MAKNGAPFARSRKPCKSNQRGRGQMNGNQKKKNEKKCLAGQLGSGTAIALLVLNNCIWKVRIRSMDVISMFIAPVPLTICIVSCHKTDNCNEQWALIVWRSVGRMATVSTVAFHFLPCGASAAQKARSEYVCGASINNRRMLPVSVKR